VSGRPRILVIRLGALGDLVQAFDAFHAIRQRHAAAEIILLTAPAFVPFARAMPWFDTVWADSRGRSPMHYLRMGWCLRRARLAQVYDLQNKPRTARYRLLLGAHVPWSRAPAGLAGHNHDRYLAQLAAAGIPPAGPAPLAWLGGGTPLALPPSPFVLLVPGCSPHLPHKRWPPERFAALARDLGGRGIGTVMVGTAADRGPADALRAMVPGLADLVGRTDLLQLADVARQAVACVGNDTGPVFLAAAIGCPTLMLMSRHTDPLRSAPWGPRVAWIKRDELASLEAGEVAAALQGLLPGLAIATGSPTL
jgi:ADP-heptose:LPS heptosyltransferase